ncbi:dihydroxy-acid dehydratase [Rhizobium sp. BK251]|uniref:dihydroxy-acid dehydratase domain-containing protein n=1 Tax=Rhizobium sp. BK251 TaxID=2512125 RepID=UPI001FE0FF53|nr:dihydroxy-acid dehydratase [Rhizobium sp. BK251]
MITIDAHRRLLQLEVEEDEIVRRRALWRQPKPRYTKGVLAKFAALARPANEGAITG